MKTPFQTALTFVVLLLALPMTSVSAFKADKSHVHPRIYCSDADKASLEQTLEFTPWKQNVVAKKKANVDKYVELCKEDPTWMVSRLQMNWKTKHNNVYLKGGDFSHSDGEAPVPTVRFSGTRDWATDYQTPSLADVVPYFDDARGMYLMNRKTKEFEWVHPSEIGHCIEKINRNIMSIVADAAFLYWQTGDEKYAEFAAPVFFKYMEGMHYRNPPVVLDESSQAGISGLATFEVIHEQVLIHLAVAYDFMYQYFVAKEYELDHSVAVFQKWGDQIIKNGISDNNWNLFQARFLTYVAMVLEDNKFYENGKGKQYYIENTFEISSARQIALKESILVYDQVSGIWPESPSYSMHVTTTLLEILALLDESTDDNELANYPIIEKAALASFQYLFPCGYTVGFGDSGHGILTPENYELLIANYRKYNLKEKEETITSLLSSLIDKGLYKHGGKDFFELFFYVDELIDAPDAEVAAAKLMSPTFYAPGVSWMAQRLGEKQDAMMVSTVGSFGNHCHANGIAIELFANNYVQGPDMGRGSSYWHPDFKEFYAKPAAHNTVVVDGKSTYNNMRGYQPYTLDNHFPESGVIEDGFKQLTFSKVSFVEPGTMSDQQRMTAIINTPEGSGYFLDIFNSKKQAGGEQRHEYIYRNLGQSLSVTDAKDKELSWKSTDELSSKKGDIKGYNYFTEKQVASSDDNLQAYFKLDNGLGENHVMKMWIKGDKDQSIFNVMSPKSNALSKGTAPKNILGQPLPTIIIRKETEAWNKPFAVVFNPYVEGKINPILDVKFNDIETTTPAQLLTITHNDGVTKDVILANTSEVQLVEVDGVYQKGLLSVIRKKKEEGYPEFMFFAGLVQYETDMMEIVTVHKPVTVSVEMKDGNLVVQNDGPVVLKLPIQDGQRPTDLLEYEDGKLVATRQGVINRSNPNQIVFRLDRALTNAIITLK